jgi:site-specific DNA recombinase
MDIGTRRGARFGVATVHGILTNPVYTGRRVFNKRDSRLFAGRADMRP